MCGRVLNAAGCNAGVYAWCVARADGHMPGHAGGKMMAAGEGISGGGGAETFF